MEKETPLYRIMFFLLFVSLLVFSPFNYSAYQFPKAAGIIIAALFFFTSGIFSGKTAPLPYNAPSLAAFLFLLMVAARHILSPSNPPGYYTAALMSSCVFFLPWLFSPGAPRIALLSASAVLASCAFGFFQVATGSLRPDSFFGNPVFFSQFLLFNFPVLTAAFLTFERKKPLFFIALFFSLVFMFLTASKGPLLSLSAAMAFFFYYILSSKAAQLPKTGTVSKYAFVTLLLAVTLVFLPGFLNSFSAAAGHMKDSVSSGGQLSVSGRAALARSGALMFASSPLSGAGPGGFGTYVQKYQSDLSGKYPFVNSSYAHNDYLQLAAEYGLPGILIFIFFLISMAVYFEKSRRIIPDNDYIMSAGFMASFMAGTCEALYNFPVFALPSAVLFWFYSGCAAAMMPAETKLTLNGKVVSAVIALILAAVFFSFPEQFFSDMQLKNAVIKDRIYTPGHEKGYLDAISTSSSNIDAVLLLAASYARSAETAQAAAAYEQASLMRPYAADTFFNLGQMYLELKLYEKALANYSRAVAIYPAFAAAHLGLSKTYRAMKIPDKSDEEFRLATLYNPMVMMPELSGSVVYFGETTAP